jgi:hypothetical protein
MRPATTDEIAQITAIDPTQPGQAIANLLTHPRTCSMLTRMRLGTRAISTIRWKRWS